MAKRIGDYKKDYAAARERGDWQGMKAANDGANAIRESLGLAKQDASVDISKFRDKSYSSSSTSSSHLEEEGPPIAKPAQKQAQTVYAQPADDYSDYIRELQEAARKKSLAELEAAYQKNLNAINTAKGQITPQYTDAKNQAAGQAALGRKNWQETAAALGLNSGAAGQASIAQNVALQNNLNALDKAEKADLAQLDLQKTQTTTDYNSAIAQAKASGDYELAKALYAEKVRVDEANRDAQITGFQQMLQQMQMDHQISQDALAQQNWKLNRKDNLAQQSWQNRYNEDQLAAGKESAEYNRLWSLAAAQADYGDFSGFTALGLSEEAVANMRAIWRQDRELALRQAQVALEQEQAALQKTQVSGGGSGGGYRTSGSGGTGMTFSTAKQMAGKGYFDDAVLNTLRQNGYTDDAIRAVYGWTGSNTGAVITSPAQLGPAALGIANNMSRVNSQSGLEILGQQIESALNSGTITQAEAEYLLRTMGY